MRSDVQCCEQAGSASDVANRGIGYTCAEAHLLRVFRHESQERKRLHPDDVRIKYPTIREACCFRLAGQTHDSIDSHVRLDGDPEIHECSFSVRGLGHGLSMARKSKIGQKT